MVNNMGWKVCLLGLALLLAPALGLAYPRIAHPVEDTAHALSSADVEDLSRRLVAHREVTGVQMAVLVVDTTAGEPIEEFANNTFQAWGGGAAGRDDGLLVILAVRDHRSRIEVGRGLEERVTGGESRGLLDASRPDLRAGRLGSALRGIVNGLVRETGGTVLSDAVAARPTPVAVPRAPIRVRPQPAPPSDDGSGIIVGVIAFVFGAAGIVAWLMARSNRRSAPHYGSYDYPSSAPARRPVTPTRAVAPAPRTPTPVPTPSAAKSPAEEPVERRRGSTQHYAVAPDPKRSSRSSVHAPTTAGPSFAATPPKPVAKQPETKKPAYSTPSYESSRRRDSYPPASRSGFGSGFVAGSVLSHSTRSSTPVSSPAPPSGWGGGGGDSNDTGWGGGGGESDGGGSSGDW
jgi:uncharacterized membrane protein YgcG